MVLHAFLVAGVTLAFAAVFAVALAVLVIADREGTPYLASGRFLLNPIAIRWLTLTQPDMVTGYATHGFRRWSEIAEVRDRGWTPQAISNVPNTVRMDDWNSMHRMQVVRGISLPAYAAFMSVISSTDGRFNPTARLPMPLADMQDWYDLLGPDAAAGPAAGLTLDEARTMGAAGALDGPTLRAMAALRTPADLDTSA